MDSFGATTAADLASILGVELHVNKQWLWTDGNTGLFCKIARIARWGHIDLYISAQQGSDDVTGNNNVAYILGFNNRDTNGEFITKRIGGGTLDIYVDKKTLYHDIYIKTPSWPYAFGFVSLVGILPASYTYIDVQCDVTIDTTGMQHISLP